MVAKLQGLPWAYRNIAIFPHGQSDSMLQHIMVHCASCIKRPNSFTICSIVLASMQTPCSHLLRVTRECSVYSLHSSFLNVGMQLICLKDLESEALVLNSEFCIRGLEGRLTFFFGAPPSRDFWSNFLVLILKG